MKFVAIIAEFNPLTNGHKYLINQAKALFPEHKILVIMSGDFVQRGEPGIISKNKRASHSILAGVDVVIELPVSYATSSAEDFAYGAIKTLNSINSVSHLIFGSECGDINLLYESANKLNNNENNMEIKKNLKAGQSYAKSVSQALNDNLLTKPNNTLAISYLNALNKLNSKIIPVTIKREDNYSSAQITSLSSATAVRACIKNNTLTKEKHIVPEHTIKDLLKAPQINLDELYSIIKYKILSTPLEKLKNIYGISEGIEYKLKEEIITKTTFDDYITSLTSKRYPSSKIKRILTHLLLDLTCDKVDVIKNSKPYIKLLAISEQDKKELLKTLSTSSATLITKKKDYEKLDNHQLLSIELDVLASNIYALLSHEQLNQDYKNKL